MATADSVKTKIQELIVRANAATNGSDTNLTTALDRLIAGFGKGGGPYSDVTLLSKLTGSPSGLIMTMLFFVLKR